MYPSILAHGLSSILAAAATVVALMNVRRLRALDIYHVIVLLLLFSLAVGVHGISHAILEKQYHFIPFNLWKID